MPNFADLRTLIAEVAQIVDTAHQADLTKIAQDEGIIAQDQTMLTADAQVIADNKQVIADLQAKLGQEVPADLMDQVQALGDKVRSLVPAGAPTAPAVTFTTDAPPPVLATAPVPVIGNGFGVPGVPAGTENVAGTTGAAIDAGQANATDATVHQTGLPSADSLPTPLDGPNQAVIAGTADVFKTNPNGAGTLAAGPSANFETNPQDAPVPVAVVMPVAADAPLPVVEAPVPVVEAPVPVVETPVPSGGVLPVVEATLPVVETPLPVVDPVPTEGAKNLVIFPDDGVKTGGPVPVVNDAGEPVPAPVTG